MEITKIDLDSGSTSTIRPNVASIPSQPETHNPKSSSPVFAIGLFVTVAVLGSVAGYLLKTSLPSGSSTQSGSDSSIISEIPAAGVKQGDIYGSANESTFKDQVTGVLDKSGINGEGTHKLVRVGGPSQTVCLSSTTIDLDLLVGHQVTLWGETFNGQKCGWLMDVGRAKVENLNASLPE